METMSAARFGLAAMLLLTRVSASAPRFEQAQSDLYGEAAQARLDRSFSSPRIEYLLFDLHAARVEAMRWAHADRAMPVGSLLKPFVALAFADFRGNDPSSFPVVDCHGAKDGCWRSAGHGAMTLEQALAESCNAYFLKLARDIVASTAGSASFERIENRYGLPEPSTQDAAPVAAADLVGLTSAWRVSPLQVAGAYARFLNEPVSGVSSRLRTGMHLAAGSHGTASHVGEHRGGILAKTGTAPCIASAEWRCAANGDGLVVIAFPADEPKELLLVRERATTGAEAARIAGAMLSTLERNDASPK